MQRRSHTLTHVSLYVVLVWCIAFIDPIAAMILISAGVGVLAITLDKERVFQLMSKAVKCTCSGFVRVAFPHDWRLHRSRTLVLLPKFTQTAFLALLIAPHGASPRYC